MSYNIMSKNASFKGDISGTIENQVNDWDNQSIGGNKTFVNAITSSASIMISGSGKVSASFFYGDGTHLQNVGGTITAYNNNGENRILAGDSSATTIKGLSAVTFAGEKLGVSGQISASLGVSGTTLHGAGGAITGLDAGNISAGSLSAARLNLASAGGLENNSDSLQINLSSSKSSLSLDSDGLRVNMHGLTEDTSYSASKFVIVQDGAGEPFKMDFTEIEAGISVRATNVSNTGGRLDNATMPTNISITSLTASSHVSASAFFGNGSALTNVGANPGGSDTQVQFNDGGALAGNSAFTFGKTTGVMTVTTGSFSKISSNLIPNANNSRALGDADNGLRWSNVASVNANISGLGVIATAAVSTALGVGTLAPTNELEVTGTAVVIGQISASAGVTGSAFHGSGKTLSGVPFNSTPSTSNIVFVADGGAQTLNTSDNLQWTGTILKATNLSASSDLQVGRHITGSGDLVFAGSTSKIHFDPAGSSATNGPSISTTNLTSLMIDGDNILNMQGDTNIRLRVGGGSSATHDMRVDITETHLSSSIDLSASAIHFADSPSGVITSGGNTFLDNNGNIFTGGITMMDGADVTLNFNDNQISGSGHVSASAFFGDGSNLTGVTAHEYLHGNKQFNTTVQNFPYFKVRAGTGQVNAISHDAHWIAPCSGSVHMVLYTPTSDGSATEGFETGDTPTFFFRKNDVTDNEFNLTFNATASAEQIVDFTYKNTTGDVNTKRAIFDFGSNAVVNITGSNSFDPGDLLVFGGHNPQDTLSDIGWMIVLSLQQN
jgi:hypothetical protein